MQTNQITHVPIALLVERKTAANKAAEFEIGVAAAAIDYRFGFGNDPLVFRENRKHLSCNSRVQRINFLSVRMNQTPHSCTSTSIEEEKYVSVQLRRKYRCKCRELVVGSWRAANAKRNGKKNLRFT